jgi:pimeloyl-ACP methyl ester carboxylesterase
LRSIPRACGAHAALLGARHLARQTGAAVLAVIASGSRHERLAAVRVPTLVFHGAADPLMPVEHARDTAACVPHAELVVVEGMGHDLPHPVWPRLVDAITRLTSRS